VTSFTNGLRDKHEDEVGGASVQEAHMRRTLNIALVIGAIFIKMTISPSKTIAEMDMAKTQASNTALIYGLHVALPDNMRHFPADLVPLP
jgi:hypothetical protein